MRNMTKGQTIRHRRKRERRQRRIILISSILFVLLICTAAALGTGKAVTVNLTADSQSILQEEALPGLTVKVSTEDSEKESKVLDKKGKYTIGSFIKDLKAGKDYELICEADGVKEGDFPIQVKLSDKLRKLLEKEWNRKVNLVVKEGVFTVKNKVGEWEGNKLKKWDGTYLANDFVTYKNKTYFLGQDQQKVVGAFQLVNGQSYYFDKEGVMITGWYDDGESKYHFADTGVMTIGWFEEESGKYCFGQDGKMLTGQQRVGTKECVFASDGKLESEKMLLDPTKPMVALTFDDGPGPRTMELLKVLEANGAKATFFMVGPNVAAYPDTVKYMESIGCEIANHTTNHKNLSKLDAAGIQSQVGGTNDIIASVVGHGGSTLRPPYGAVNDNVKAYAGMPLAMWSVDTLDWKVKNKEQTVANVWSVESSRGLDGEVVLMHDIHTWSVDAAIEMIPQLVAKGYQVVTMSEMAEARGVDLVNGQKYFSFKQK